MKRLGYVFGILPILICGCSNDVKMPGKREAILADDISLRKVKQSNEQVVIQTPNIRSSHVDLIGSKSHVADNNLISIDAKVVSDIALKKQIATQLVYYGDSLLAVTTSGELVSFSKDGVLNWGINIFKMPKDLSFEGGITAQDGVVYVTANTGDVAAINIQSKKELWKKNLKFPIKGTPVIAGNKMIFSNIENYTFALDIYSGSTVWMNVASSEDTILSEIATPAIKDEHVVVTKTSGDVMLLDLASGTEIWSDVLMPADGSDSGSAILHISASPVIGNGVVFVVGSESKTVAIDMASGIRVWENELGAYVTPIVTGNSMFMITSDNKLVCLSQRDGSQKWSTNLLEEQKKDKKWYDFSSSPEITWNTPLMVNGQIIVTGNSGEIRFYDAKTGKLTRIIPLKSSITADPVVVNKTMYVVTGGGKLHIIR